MIDVFNYLLVPGELNVRVSRLESSAPPHGVLIECKWVTRAQLGTSRIGSLQNPPPSPVVEDLDLLTLTLASPVIVGSYRAAISEFAHRVLAHTRARRVHLAPAYYTTAVCGEKRVSGVTTAAPITCRRCALQAVHVAV